MAGRASVAMLVVAQLAALSARASWVPVGPFGGDARALAADPSNPDRVYAGAGTGQVYFSSDGGRVWSRFTALAAPSDWVVDNVLIDPANPRIIYAAMWSLGTGGGGIFKTSDGGRSWRSLEGMSGQSVRALAMAPSHSQTLVAGTLEGVFRTEDGGDNWQRISPLGHAELRNVESVAIDPVRPEIIYVGTWHLPWKTTDGGGHWASIKKGMVDDSDVFSIAVDPARPGTVFATACTGIYRSDNAGEEWSKIQGIPESSRRTRTLVLDPRDPETVYAGTTEGLWRTPDGGHSWQRLTSHTWVINDILLDPRDPSHFLIAMDGAGIMESWDGGKTFRSANRGYSQVQISRVVADPVERERLYVSVLHGGEFGGVFTTTNRGASWQQLSAGLDGHDVLSLLVQRDPEWKVLAGTPGGVFEYSPDHPIWKNTGRWELPPGSSMSTRGPAVRDLYQRTPRDPIYAATSAGLFESPDGKTWKRLPLSSTDDGVWEIASFGEQGQNLLAATSLRLALSRDGGATWNTVSLDGGQPMRIHRIAPNPTRPAEVFVAAEAGLFRSVDAGLSWSAVGHGLPTSSQYDAFVSIGNPQRVFVAGASGAFYSLDGGDWYSRLGDGPSSDGLSTGIAGLQLLDGRDFFAVSLHNGLFLQDGREVAPPRLWRPQQ
jgi:photosystem II stability/assembly factor-like uncharacterized protein